MDIAMIFGIWVMISVVIKIVDWVIARKRFVSRMLLDGAIFAMQNGMFPVRGAKAREKNLLVLIKKIMPVIVYGSARISKLAWEFEQAYKMPLRDNYEDVTQVDFENLALAAQALYKAIREELQ